MPELKGFSERNLKLMVQFAREYPHAFDTSVPIGQPPVAQLPWAHNVLLMQMVKDTGIRLWYVQQTLANGWSRNTLAGMIKTQTHRRQNAAVTNFAQTLPAAHADLAQQLLKDPYIFDFLTLEEPFHERELETGLIGHVERFLLELGRGFAFVGRNIAWKSATGISTSTCSSTTSSFAASLSSN